MATEPVRELNHDVEESEIRRIKLGPQGRIVVPAEFREALGVKPGDTLYASIEDGRLVFQTREQIIAGLRALFAHVPKGRSVVDELLAERLAEAAREAQEMQEWLQRHPPPP